ncbi:nucleotide exchange factor GrpE [Methanoculleus sp. FWC-SCC1]|uniref:Protein GrpE n=1 Tax=Methanoculleus frigidifontis TaxID=2584085 RepID=A0ABT8MD05_9EURY|nr:nucleotide exchange factor GrpE [Methanoculleus sp. FWC-SCC1]MDN7025824.1 nucleotide exchange factor GrpE [Methanoculleus sp. FWC-SCC1]
MTEEPTEQNEVQRGTPGSEPEAVSSDLEELRKAYDDLNDRFLRLAADFDNYQRRMARELDTRTTFAIEAFAAEILDVLDNFERAEAADDASLREGLEQIKKLFTAILQRHEIVPIDCVGRPFDPQGHEAVAYVPADAPEGTVIDEVIRGYCMKDKVIRCAKVVVSRGKEE